MYSDRHTAFAACSAACHFEDSSARIKPDAAFKRARAYYAILLLW